MQIDKIFSTPLRCASTLMGIAICMALAGCGGKEAADAGAVPAKNASKKAVPASTPAPASVTIAPIARPLSVFSTNDLHDPFFPKAKPKVTASAQANTPAVQKIGPGEIAAALEAGLKGTMGPASDRLALIHGVLLEQDRETTLSVPIQGSIRRIKVKATRILRDTVELKVEGVPNVVTLKVRR